MRADYSIMQKVVMTKRSISVRRIRELISEGQLLARSGEEHLGKERFFEFIRESAACVCALEDKIPSSAKAMTTMRWTYPIDDDADVSENAFRDDCDELRDFIYRSFRLAVKHLRTAEARCLIDQDLSRESVAAGPPHGSPISVGVPADVRNSKAEPTISDLEAWPAALDENAVAKLLQIKVAAEVEDVSKQGTKSFPRGIACPIRAERSVRLHPEQKKTTGSDTT